MILAHDGTLTPDLFVILLQRLMETVLFFIQWCGMSAAS